MMPRFLREVAKREIRMPELWPDAVSGRYSEVDEAIIQAVAYDWIGLKMNSSRLPLFSDFSRLLASSTDINQDEVRLARDAARVAISAYRNRQLDSDLAPQPSPDATA
jgi:hypothetical protein